MNKVYAILATVSATTALIVLSAVVLPNFAHAQAYDEGCCDNGGYNWGGDTSYGWGTDTSYNWGSDTSYNWPADTSNSWNTDTSYNWGSQDSSYNLGTTDTSYGWNSTDSSYGWGVDDSAHTVRGLDDDFANTVRPIDDTAHTVQPIYDRECDCYRNSTYNNNCGCYTYTNGNGYTTYGYPTSNGRYSVSGYPVTPVTISSPRYPSTPTYTSGGGSSISNTNTTVTNTTVTNIDNSINGSFNNYNSNNTIVTATPIPVTPQYTNPAPYCTISNTGSYGSTYLSWNATNATSAYLSGVGSVAVSGSRTVSTYGMTTYTLTVYGANGQSATCATTVQGTIYNNYQPTPYVSLTQIPYTGFDFGTFGNAMYWALLASFALAAGYLVIYFKGGALAFAHSYARTRTYAPVVAPKAPILVEKEAHASKLASIVETVRRGTMDTMAIVASKDGSMPKIVITRN